MDSVIWSVIFSLCLLPTDWYRHYTTLKTFTRIGRNNVSTLTLGILKEKQVNGSVTMTSPALSAHTHTHQLLQTSMRIMYPWSSQNNAAAVSKKINWL